MEALKKIDEGFAGILRIFVTALCVGIALILFIRVIIRFTPLTVALSWTDEVVEWMMAWMIFTGSTLIMRDNGHFRVDLLESKLKKSAAVHIINLLISLLGVVFFALLFYYSVALVKQATQFSPILKVSVRLPYSSIPVNCALMLIYQVRDIIKECRALTGTAKTV